MKSKLHLALIALRISTIIYYLIFLAVIFAGFFTVQDGDGFERYVPWIMAIVLFPFLVFLEVLILHLKQRRYWAWIGGVIIGAMYAPSLFLPLGIMILMGLLSDASREEFGIGGKVPKSPNPPPVP